MKTKDLTRNRLVAREQELEPAMDLIRMSHEHFIGRPKAPRMETNEGGGNRDSGAPRLKLFVIGATGRTGREVVQQALARGHQVTAFVRSPENITVRHERLAIRQGDAMDENQLFQAMQDHEVVISTLGPREVFKRSSMMHDSAVAATRAMQRAGVNRLVVLSAAAHFPGVLNRIGRFVLQQHLRDSLAMEEVVQSSGLDWTIARPPRLTQGDCVRYRSREGAPPRMGFTLARKAVASFMLDAIGRKAHLRKIVGIAK